MNLNTIFLSACRFGLDRIDDLLYILLRARFLISTRTVLYKDEHHIIDGTRENSIMKRLGSGPLDKVFVKEQAFTVHIFKQKQNTVTVNFYP